MLNESSNSHDSFLIIRSLLGSLTFVLFLLTCCAVIYFDDIQLASRQLDESPTIYNVRIVGGIKMIDGISVLLFILLIFYEVLKQNIVITSFHRSVGVIFLVYCYAGIVGFVYSFFYRYEYHLWLQDFQQTIYMVGFFILTFYLLDTKYKWKIFVIVFFSALALKNILILKLSVMGVGKEIGGWAFRASQNAEFAYFPMMFFPLLLLVLTRRSLLLKSISIVILTVYMFNSLIGIYRTVWVMLLIGLLYLYFQLENKTRFRLILYGALGLSTVLIVISELFPKFITLAWNYKFASIFDWSLEGDRSNATRRLEIINVTNYVFRNFAFLQGMGLGAWWDDSARRLFPDLGSGFTYKTQYHNTHMWYLTQFLKLGLVAMVFYWYSLYKIFRDVSRFVKNMSWDRWEKSIVLGLNIGLLCGIVSSADFVRLFLVIGINIGLTSSFIYLDQQNSYSVPD